MLKYMQEYIWGKGCLKTYFYIYLLNKTFVLVNVILSLIMSLNIFLFQMPDIYVCTLSLQCCKKHLRHIRFAITVLEILAIQRYVLYYIYYNQLRCKAWVWKAWKFLTLSLTKQFQRTHFAAIRLLQEMGHTMTFTMVIFFLFKLNSV